MYKCISVVHIYGPLHCVYVRRKEGDVMLSAISRCSVVLITNDSQEQSCLPTCTYIA